jgi:hypothetical protein
MNVEGPCHSADALACRQTPGPAERGAARLGGPPAVVGALDDAQPLVLGHGA